MTTVTQKPQADGSAAGNVADTLTIIDNRTGRQYEVPIEDDSSDYVWTVLTGRLWRRAAGG